MKLGNIIQAVRVGRKENRFKVGRMKERHHKEISKCVQWDDRKTGKYSIMFLTNNLDYFHKASFEDQETRPVN